MIHAKAAQHSHPDSLMEVLHRMTMQSRANQARSQSGKNKSKSFSMQNALPNGDPPEVMMWGGN